MARALLAGCATATLAAGCGDLGLVNEPREQEVPEHVIETFVVTESDSGVVHWRMRAARAVEAHETGWVHVLAPVVDVYDRTGQHESRIIAAQGDVNRRTHDLTGRGGVRITGRDGTIVRTDSMQWAASTQRLTTNAVVWLRRKGNTITGRGFESDGALRSYRIFSDVRAHVEDAEGTFGSD